MQSLPQDVIKPCPGQNGHAYFFTACNLQGVDDFFQVPGGFTEMIVKKEDGQQNIHKGANNDQQLHPRCLLDGLLFWCCANFTGTVLRFVFVKQAVKQTSQADAKGRFEEQKNEAKQAGDAGDDAVGIEDDQQKEHEG